MTKSNGRRGLSGFTISSFFENQLSGGILILAAIGLALLWSNSPWAGSYFQAINASLSFSLAGFTLAKTLHAWINDGLMTLFFLMIGFEIKRELLAGELSKLKNALFPIVAAVGGMIVPIAIFLGVNAGSATIRGWGIPMSTDIAFTLSMILLLGKRISKSLRVSIIALAIIDDIGALIVIALFYSSQISLWCLGGIVFVCLIILLCNKLRLRFGFLYFVFGVALWLLFLQSGIHPAIAGVLLAFLIPANSSLAWESVKNSLKGEADKIDERFNNEDAHFEFADEQSKRAFGEIEKLVKKVEPPLQRYERSLKAAVNFVIVPLFAFVNSGIAFGNFDWRDLTSPLALGIILGLMVGKSTGVFAFSFLFSKLKIIKPPAETSWPRLYGVGWLAGIGFTMSLFIAELSFRDEHLLAIAKLSIFLGSLLSAAVGFVMIKLQRAKGRKEISP